jgi:hypothetical protein
MNWPLAASIAEVISAVAVVASLVYLAVQVRANTKATRASAFQTAIQSEMDLATVFVENARVWDKVVTGAPLAEGEEMRAGILLYNMLMLDTARRHQQYAEGYLEAQAWKARRETLPSIVGLPVYRGWRASLGARGHSADFLALLDECAASSGTSSDAIDEP